MARDCTVKTDPNNPAGAQNLNKGNFDSEYASLMAELGETGAGSGTGKSWAGSGAGHDITAGGSNVPPWRRPEMWQTSTPTNQNQNMQNGYRPPQPYNGASGAPGATGAAYGSGYGTQGWYQNGYPQNYGGQDYSAAYAQYYQQQYSQTQTVTSQQ